MGTIVKGYTWDFGDGNFSNDSKPWHVYNTPGVYTVNLTVVFTSGKVCCVKEFKK